MLSNISAETCENPRKPHENEPITIYCGSTWGKVGPVKVRLSILLYSLHSLLSWIYFFSACPLPLFCSYFILDVPGRWCGDNISCAGHT